MASAALEITARGGSTRSRFVATIFIGSSTWVAMSQSPATIERLTADDRPDWQRLRGRPGFRAWSDDHASLLPLMRY